MFLDANFNVSVSRFSVICQCVCMVWVEMLHINFLTSIEHVSFSV